MYESDYAYICLNTHSSKPSNPNRASLKIYSETIVKTLRTIVKSVVPKSMDEINIYMICRAYYLYLPNYQTQVQSAATR